MVVSEYFCGLLTGKTRISDEKSWEVPLEFGDWEEYYYRRSLNATVPLHVVALATPL